MRAFLFFCSPTHTGVLSQKRVMFSLRGSHFSLEFSAALFVLVTLVIIISTEALMNDLFKSAICMHSQDVRCCCFLCPLALLVLLSKVDA